MLIKTNPGILQHFDKLSAPLVWDRLRPGTVDDRWKTRGVTGIRL